jgi:hypothetical protein
MLENTFFVTHTNFYQALGRRIRGDNPGKGVAVGALFTRRVAAVSQRLVQCCDKLSSAGPTVGSI